MEDIRYTTLKYSIRITNKPSLYQGGNRKFTKKMMPKNHIFWYKKDTQ